MIIMDLFMTILYWLAVAVGALALFAVLVATLLFPMLVLLYHNKVNEKEDKDGKSEQAEG